MRYKYISYKYTRRLGSDPAFQSIMESYNTWGVPCTVWRPSTDVYETSGEIIVFMEIAGVKEEDLTVTLFSDILIVEGQRKQPLLAEMNACHGLGIRYGNFRSEIYIPHPVDHDKVTAEYKNGFLRITLKRVET